MVELLTFPLPLSGTGLMPDAIMLLLLLLLILLRMVREMTFVAKSEVEQRFWKVLPLGVLPLMLLLGVLVAQRIFETGF